MVLSEDTIVLYKVKASNLFIYLQLNIFGKFCFVLISFFLLHFSADIVLLTKYNKLIKVHNLSRIKCRQPLTIESLHHLLYYYLNLTIILVQYVQIKQQYQWEALVEIDFFTIPYRCTIFIFLFCFLHVQDLAHTLTWNFFLRKRKIP